MLQNLSLDGTWHVRWFDGQRGTPALHNKPTVDLANYIEAQVPGEIHLDAMRAGMIQEPTVGTNVLAARWVEECIWGYRKEFDTPPTAVAGGTRAWLVFDRIEGVADVYLNGEMVGHHRNDFYPCRLEVTGKIKPGNNWLNVQLESGLFDVSDKPAVGWTKRNDLYLHKRHWLRKPQCSFEWDWSPRLINLGLSKSVRLEWTTDPVRVEQLVSLVTLNKDLQTGKVVGRVFVEGLTEQTHKGQLMLRLAETGQTVTAEVEIKPGQQMLEAQFEVTSPKLWWPVGHGPQHLYTLEASLRVGGVEFSLSPKLIGFRHVRVNQEPHPQAGRYFIVEVNGKKIFCKGGNFVPAEIIYARLDEARYDRLTDLALEANFNLLRVWGGGLYEADEFYDLCDRKGILVWQEFIYACMRYPMTDQAFFDDAKREAVANIRRLANHPSLIIWCGNNEMEVGNWSWGYDKGSVYPDYAFFHLTLPQLMAKEDPTRYYQPSSPFSPEGKNPEADEIGDQHPWSLGFYDTDLRKYRKMICRFPNEGGFLGPTALPTMRACLQGGPEKIYSFPWQVHDNAIATWEDPSPQDVMIDFLLGKKVTEMSVEEFTYWGGLMQSEALREYIDNFHRRMFDSASAIFWMYNDAWPAVRTWTIVDYYLRRTPSFHPVRRAMASVNVVLAEEGEHIVVFGINETNEAVNADLRYGIFALTGQYLMDQKKSVTLAANASTRLATFAKSEWKEIAESMAFAILSIDGKLVARNRLMLPLFKEMKWNQAKVAVKVEKGKAIFTCDQFAWGVCLDLDGEKVIADNFFDVYPGQAYVMDWPHAESPKVMKLGNS